MQIQRLVALHGARSASFVFRHSTIPDYRGDFLAFWRGRLAFTMPMKESCSRRRRTDGSCTHDNKKRSAGATYRSLRSKLGSDRPVSATWPWTMSTYGGRRPDLLAHRWKIKVIPLLRGARRRSRCFVDTQAIGLPVAIIFLAFISWILARFRIRFLPFLLMGCDFG